MPSDFYTVILRRWHGKSKDKLVRSGKRKREYELVDETEMGQTRYDAGEHPTKSCSTESVFPHHRRSKLPPSGMARSEKAVQALGIKNRGY
jgi:hypothetical protein